MADMRLSFAIKTFTSTLIDKANDDPSDATGVHVATIPIRVYAPITEQAKQLHPPFVLEDAYFPTIGRGQVVKNPWISIHDENGVTMFFGYGGRPFQYGDVPNVQASTAFTLKYKELQTLRLLAPTFKDETDLICFCLRLHNVAGFADVNIHSLN